MAHIGWRKAMTWETPRIVEIACGLEVTAYTPADDSDDGEF
jgi:coenzyme PQQ precursor peptide PqqA